MALPLAALALAGTGMAAYGAVADEAAQYRTVAAGVGDVDQVLSLTGVIESSGRSDLAFGTSGTVAKVPVAQGDAVEKGDVIAVLDRSALRAAVDRAKSDLAKAKAQLADDLDAQTSAVSTATASMTDTSSASTPARKSAQPADERGSSEPGNAALLAQLRAQQEAVIAAQKAASVALATGAEALATQEQVCAETETPVEPTDSATEGSSEGPADDPGTSSGVSDECQAALAAVQSAQAATATALLALQTALETLGGTLTTALGAVATPDQRDAGADESADASAAATEGDNSGSSDGQAGPTVTAATLAQDQASIDRSAAELASARASLRAAVVRAPAAGKVVSLAVASGDAISSGDTVAILVAPGLTTVSLAVTATQAAQLTVGTEVDVTPAGASEALKGSITRVENIPVSSTSEEDPTYGVEVTLDERDLSLPDGIPASVAVVVGSANDVVTVPASAVVDGTVTVMTAGQPQRTRVTTGIVGSTEVEIVEGLDAGAEVVLADLGADLPSADTEDQGGDRIQFGGGGPGGNFTGGGPPGGVLPGR
ncbi:biotin/lipoyl-binding protein [Nocardioides sp. WS12]|uniref:biotin/lipoyl-binding protein n=1 Tax=Nocardioides sp. WS12 TaxID=2486272 RepID=UPI0015F82220|nr:biotin/lipoyl-binding protein [Nocardioides sp. WS12]